MGAPTVLQGDLYVNGNLGGKTVNLPAGAITDAMIAPLAGVQASKLIHQNPGVTSGVQLFGPTTAIAALTQTLGMAYASGTLVAFGAWIEVQATGSDRTVTVDLQKSTGGGAYATVLSATVGFTNTSTIRTRVSGTINSDSYVAGDIFRVVVTVAGVSSAQAEGLTLQLEVQENAQ